MFMSELYKISCKGIIYFRETDITGQRLKHKLFEKVHKYAMGQH